MNPSGLSPNDADLSLRHTNGSSFLIASIPSVADRRSVAVSSPSVIHSKPSQQSITASEDYYSLSGSSNSGDTLQAPRPVWSTNTLDRYQTPPERYRTPQERRAQDVIDSSDEEVRKTPMRGEGVRRSRGQEYSSDSDAAQAGPSTYAAAGAAVGSSRLSQNGIKRKPVPSQIMEGQSPDSQEYIDQTNARSSVARDLDREGSPPTPGQDDTPYIRFALDQLTRDEEVRGSRRYPGQQESGYPVQTPSAYPDHGRVSPIQAPVPTYQDRITQVRHVRPEEQYDRDGDSHGIDYGYAGAAAGTAAAAGGIGTAYATHHGDDEIQPSQQWPDPSRRFDEPLQRPSQDVPVYQQQQPRQGSDLFVPVANEDRHLAPLNFLPGTLRPLSLILFLLLLLTLLALLLLCAIWSLTHHGIFNYGSFGDSKYFIFEYLPTLLGMLLFMWVVQMQVSLYRIAPFIAMASETSQQSREYGAQLPLYPKTFLLPYLGHFKARQPVVGFFMFVAWLQIWSIPLLASAFNVHYYTSNGIWRWIATAAIIWAVIILYLLLLVASVALLFWLIAKRRSHSTGLRWDPRSLADMIVLLERSNALSMTEDDELRLEAPKLGYWRTTHTNEAFHGYGIAEKPARKYSLENGRIREKVPAWVPEPRSRFSDHSDTEMGREKRESREKMLPRAMHSMEDDRKQGSRTGGRTVPWFLRPSSAALWAIIAVVLLLAFLIVSYIPSTRVSAGFSPGVPSAVNTLGYSGTNFLYSFVPALIAMIAFLGLLDIDYAYRRLQPYTSLFAASQHHGGTGELAERSLLLSYVADLPGFVTASAVASGHYRLALLSHLSTAAAALPILGGGVFWAQFYIPKQDILIYAHMPGYYALTAFVALYTLACLLTFPNHWMRNMDREVIPRGNRAMSWMDIQGLVRMSRILDDVQFHSPRDRTDIVTRLLAPAGSGAAPAAGGGLRPGIFAEAAASKMSLADSVRGFARARQQAADQGAGGTPRYSLGRYLGRDGREGVGLDRVRS